MYGNIASVVARSHVSDVSSLMVGCVLRLQVASYGGVVCIAPGSIIVVRLCGLR